MAGVLKWFRSLATAIGCVVLLMWATGALVPVMDFRLCYGVQGRCVLLFESGGSATLAGEPGKADGEPAQSPNRTPEHRAFEQSIARAK